MLPRQSNIVFKDLRKVRLVKSDEKRMQQVLLLLLQNALYSAKVDSTIYIELLQHKELSKVAIEDKDSILIYKVSYRP